MAKSLSHKPHSMLSTDLAAAALEPVAIVGIGCRIPGGASSAAAYWDLLIEGRSGISEVPDDRWNAELFYDRDTNKPGKTNTRWGGFVPGLELFDAGFFGISPREAQAMDPQQRALLQTAWEALADAGIPPERLAGVRGAVFVGASTNDYGQVQRFGQRDVDVHVGTGNAMSIIANRLSHRLDLRGPSVVVDTACSSSLVATDLAVRALLNDNCDIAIAAGVNTLFDPGMFINFSKANMMSPRGRCHTFDASADGYVRAEGVGVVILKRLSGALADGDRIYAVIRGTAVNQDGHTSTITVPSALAQASMLRLATERAGVAPRDVAFAEAHGTGTPVGDPIEAHAIGSVFGQARLSDQGVIIGAGKTNIGHAESAAGVFGLIKTALCLYYRTVPANLNFSKPNPNIPFSQLGIDLPLKSRSLVESDKGLFGAVNSFGFGGTNASALLSAPPVAATKTRARPSKGGATPFPLTAASATALAKRAQQMAVLLAEDPDLSARDLAGTLALRTGQLPFRLFIDAENRESLLSALGNLSGADDKQSDTKGAAITQGRALQDERPVFVFPGQGGQWWAMGRELMQNDPIYRETVEAFDRHFMALSGWSIVDELNATEKQSKIDLTAVTQPAIFAVQAGLVARWRAWGVEPAAVIGHSFGEVAAAWTAGVLTLEQAAHVIYHRARLSAETEGKGAIAAVGLSPERARAFLAEQGAKRVEIAAINGAEMVSLAGDKQELATLLAALQAHDKEIFCRPIRMDYAPHTSLMEPIHDALLTALAPITPSSGTIPMISTVSGAVIEGQLIGADYWWRNIRQAVLFKAGIEQAITRGHRLFLEIGPHATLSGLVKAALAGRGASAVIASLQRGQAEGAALRAALALLYVQGCRLDWQALLGGPTERVPLPTYPWERDRFWAGGEEWRRRYFVSPVNALLGEEIPGPQRSWETDLDLRSQAFLADHRVGGSVLFPAAGYLEVMLGAANQILGDGPLELEEVSFFEALVLEEERAEQLRTCYDAARRRLEVYSRTREGAPDWVLRAQATLNMHRPKAPQKDLPRTPKSNERSRDGKTFYKEAQVNGFDFGPAFQGVKRLWPDLPICRGEIQAAKDVIGDLKQFFFHPAVLDSCLQVGNGAITRLAELGFKMEARTFLPVRIAKLRWFRRPQRRLNVQSNLLHLDDSKVRFNFVCADQKGASLELEGFVSKSLGRNAMARRAQGAQLAYYRDTWVEQPLAAPDAIPARHWLLIAHQKRDMVALARRLQTAGDRVTQLVSAEAFAKTPQGYSVEPNCKEHYSAAFAQLAEGGDLPDAIVCLWALETSPQSRDHHLLERQGRMSSALVAMAQALAEQEASNARLFVVTARARLVPGDQADDAAQEALAQMPLAGMTRTVGTELAKTRATSLDVVGLNKAGDVATLVRELRAHSPEREVALRGAQRFVCRLEPSAAHELPARQLLVDPQKEALPYRLTMPAAGILDSLHLEEMPRPVPMKGEAIVAVKAVGLNFRDVMAATGLLPDEAESGIAWQSLGLEGAGVVTALGQGVRGLKVGDRVMFAAKGCFASHLRLPALLLQPLPRHLSFAEAATIPSAYMTAHHALITLARLRKGERILIHMATGGVGLAAIELAKLVGAEIFATAGSASKRAYLRKLGIKHVMDSRSLDFTEEVLAATDGRGLDVVLNALSGVGIDAGLRCLAPFGRFLEIGKRDVYADSAIGMKLLRNNISFHAIDLAAMGEQKPQESAENFKALSALLAKRKIKPLPTELFGIDQAAEAFKRMAKAQHIGKVVVTLGDRTVTVAQSAHLGPKLRRDGAYLVTGAMTGFGAEVAKLLAGRGAGALVLVGRRGAVTPASNNMVKLARSLGAKVFVVKGDVTKLDDVERAIGTAEAAGFVLRGVVHSAVVLDDAFLTQLTEARLRHVLAPKVLGSWNLHLATEKRSLDFFVGFSSFAAMLGSSGQANYVAANSYLEALMRWRNAHGLPGQAISWGALGEIGLVARNDALQSYLATMGIEPIKLRDALDAFTTVLCKDVPATAFVKLDWAALGRVAPAISSVPRLAGLVASMASGASGGGRLRGELLAAPQAQRAIMLEAFLREQIAKVLKIDASGIEVGRPLMELGLDSLTSFELKNRIETELAINLPVGRFLQRPTVGGLATGILEHLKTNAQSTSEAAQQKAGEAILPANLRYVWRLYGQGLRATSLASGWELAFAVGVNRQLDRQRLSATLQEVASRYDSLRAFFPERDGEPDYQVADSHPLGVELYDVSMIDEALFETMLRSHAQAPIDPLTGPLVRLKLFRRSASEDVLLLQASHLVVEGWSLVSLLAELLAGYFGAGTTGYSGDGKPLDLVEIGAQQKAFAQSPAGLAQRNYWLEKIEGVGGPYLSFFGKARPKGVPHRLMIARSRLGDDITAAIQKAAVQSGASLYAYLLAAASILFGKMLDRQQLLISTVATARTTPDLMASMAWLGNLLAVRLRLDEQASFAELLAIAQQEAEGLLANQDYPFALIAEARGYDDYLSVLGDAQQAATPWQQIGFQARRPDHMEVAGFDSLLLNEQGARLTIGELEARTIDLERPTDFRDMNLTYQVVGGRLAFELYWNAELFDEARGRQFLDLYEALLRRVIAKPMSRVADLQIPLEPRNVATATS